METYRNRTGKVASNQHAVDVVFQQGKLLSQKIVNELSATTGDGAIFWNLFLEYRCQVSPARQRKKLTIDKIDSFLTESSGCLDITQRSIANSGQEVCARVQASQGHPTVKY